MTQKGAGWDIPRPLRRNVPIFRFPLSFKPDGHPPYRTKAKMKFRTSLFSSLVLTGLFAFAQPASAQSDILLRLRSGSPLTDRFRVDSAGGVVAIGTLGQGIIPASGAGTRMMWYPFKAAFRAGGVLLSEWDDANMGFYTIATGAETTAAGNYSTVTGNLSATGTLGVAAVAMGNRAYANGSGAISLGTRTTADANNAVAIGQRASANGFSGAIVFADASTTDSLEASAINQFSVRAAGGYRLFTNATTTTGVSLNAGGSSWNVISDRNRKYDFSTIDGEDVLARIRLAPVSMWRYRDEADRTVRHIGPMAQDWNAAFSFNNDPTTINMSDIDGVNLAAAQALERRTATMQNRLKALEDENAELRARMARMEAALKSLTAK